MRLEDNLEDTLKEVESKLRIAFFVGSILISINIVAIIFLLYQNVNS